jgi:cobalamin biosynthesis protein CbiG
MPFNPDHYTAIKAAAAITLEATSPPQLNVARATVKQWSTETGAQQTSLVLNLKVEEVNARLVRWNEARLRALDAIASLQALKADILTADGV